MCEQKCFMHKKCCAAPQPRPSDIDFLRYPPTPPPPHSIVTEIWGFTLLGGGGVRGGGGTIHRRFMNEINTFTKNNHVDKNTK